MRHNGRVIPVRTGSVVQAEIVCVPQPLRTIAQLVTRRYGSYADLLMVHWHSVCGPIA